MKKRKFYFNCVRTQDTKIFTIFVLERDFIKEAVEYSSVRPWTTGKNSTGSTETTSKKQINLSDLIGIDIGGTSVKMGVVNKAGKLEHKLVFPTRTLQSATHFLEVLKAKLEQLLQETDFDQSALLGIGIGAPGHSTIAGEITGAVNLPFPDPIPVVAYLEQATRLPVFLLKDAKVAALGEKYWGAARDMDNFIMLMLGTGLGYAAFSEGRIINGHQGLAGEFGHGIIQFDGRQCNCGKRGCLETYLSATGLKRTAFELLGSDKRDSALRKLTYDQVTPEMIASLAWKNDPLALEAFQRTAWYLGVTMANLTEQLGPEGFIISGGLAEAGALLLEPAQQIMHDHLQPIYRSQLQIRKASLSSDEVGILGAAALVMNHIQLQA